MQMVLWCMYAVELKFSMPYSILLIGDKKLLPPFYLVVLYFDNARFPKFFGKTSANVIYLLNKVMKRLHIIW